jgi:hypothetical protein
MRKSELNEVSIKGNQPGRLFVFDLDDTLIVSSAKIQVLDPSSGKVLKSLTPAEFNSYTHTPGHVLSFREFEDAAILRDSTFIYEILDVLLSMYRKGVHVSIITARSSSKLVRDFFLSNGIDIHPHLVIAVNDSDWGFTGSIAERKKQAIEMLVNQGYNDFVFFDDDEKNLRLAKDVEKEKGVRVKVVHVG